MVISKVRRKQRVHNANCGWGVGGVWGPFVADGWISRYWCFNFLGAADAGSEEKNGKHGSREEDAVGAS